MRTAPPRRWAAGRGAGIRETRAASGRARVRLLPALTVVGMYTGRVGQAALARLDWWPVGGGSGGRQWGEAVGWGSRALSISPLDISARYFRSTSPLDERITIIIIIESISPLDISSR